MPQSARPNWGDIQISFLRAQERRYLEQSSQYKLSDFAFLWFTLIAGIKHGWPVDSGKTKIIWTASSVKQV